MPRDAAKPLRAYFETGTASGLSVRNVAARLEQLNLPGHHFHALRGERRWSIRVTGNWRITFGWGGADAVELDLEDDH
jgi:toxin HigB-1